MTTQHHSALALMAAFLSANASPPTQILVLAGLVLLHIPSDAFPHWHLYNFKEIRATGQGKLGAFIELGGGLIILPFVFCFLTGLNPIWAILCVFAASLFDFGVAFEQITKIKLGIDELNHRLHWWDKSERETIEERKKSEKFMKIWEMAQSGVIFGLMIYLAIKF